MSRTTNEVHGGAGPAQTGVTGDAASLTPPDGCEPAPPVPPVSEMSDGLDAIRSRAAVEYTYRIGQGEPAEAAKPMVFGPGPIDDVRTLLAALDDCTASLDAARERKKALREALGRAEFALSLATGATYDDRSWLDEAVEAQRDAHRALAEPAGEQP